MFTGASSSITNPSTTFCELAAVKMSTLQKHGITGFECDSNGDSSVVANYSPRACHKKKKSCEDLATKICLTLKVVAPFVVRVDNEHEIRWFYNEGDTVMIISNKDFGDDEYSGKHHKSISSHYKEHPNLITVILKAVIDPEVSHKRSWRSFWKR